MASTSNDNISLAGLRVAAFESRRADDMARLIERQGGVALVSPSMREEPIENHATAIDFAHRVMTGQIDIVILMTGVGVRYLMAGVERQVDQAQLSRGPFRCGDDRPRAQTRGRASGTGPSAHAPCSGAQHLARSARGGRRACARGPANGRPLGIWRRQRQPRRGTRSPRARVESLAVYRWDLPHDIGPLERNIRAIVAREVDVLLFTSSHQAVNLLRVAESLALGDALRAALEQTVVASIGPTTTETLGELGLPVDIEPEHGKMGHLVIAAAEQAPRLLADKRREQRVWIGQKPPEKIAAHAGPWSEGLFLRTCRREPVERTPVWLMRQAGRYLPEYRAIRSKTTFLELCKNPALCAQVMLETVARLNVDAAIIFSDLLPILEPMGFDLEFAKGEGPVIHNPVRELKDIDRVRELESLERLEFVFETVRLTRAGLPDHLPVIGFAGAAVYVGQLCDRGRGQPQLCPHQGAHVPRPRGVGTRWPGAGPRGGAVSQRADRGRRPGSATIR